MHRERLSSRQGCIFSNCDSCVSLLLLLPIAIAGWIVFHCIIAIERERERESESERIALATKKHVDKHTDRRTGLSSTKRLSHAQTHRSSSTVVAGAVLKQSACEIVLFVCCCCCFQLSLLLLLSFSCCFHCNSLTFRFRPACSSFTIAFARLTQSVQITTSSILLTAPTFGYADCSRTMAQQNISVRGSWERNGFRLLCKNEMAEASAETCFLQFK